MSIRIIHNFLISVFLLILFSCKENSKSRKLNSEQDIDFEELTLKDTEEDIRIKLRKTAKLDNLELKEVEIYDEFFEDYTSEFALVKKDFGFDKLTVICYEDTLRFTQVHLLHIKEQSIKEAIEVRKKIEQSLKENITNGTYQKFEKQYLSGKVINEYWYLSIVVSQNRNNGSQDYWVLSSPQSEYSYLKHKTESFKSNKDVLIKFLFK